MRPWGAPSLRRHRNSAPDVRLNASQPRRIRMGLFREGLRDALGPILRLLDRVPDEEKTESAVFGIQRGKEMDLSQAQ
jgi:hypothetical protein